MFLWASGNRDELEFNVADRYDIDRRPRRSLSYGHGIHQCIGERLGNLEGRVLLEEILAAAPDFEVRREGVERNYGEFLHGYHKMPIEFAPRALPESS
jgi:cytochrome P450